MSFMSSTAGFFTSKMNDALGWARKFSIFQYPFVTACCGMEYMSTAASHYDIDRFGAGFPRFSPRQSDVLFVVGTISHKMAPVLKDVYDKMCEPKWVVAFGVCTCTGGFYDNYSTVMGIDTIIPVDIYIPGCPPRPENVIDGLMKLQDKIQKGEQSRTLYDPQKKNSRPIELQQGYSINQHIKNIEESMS
jgi:NADH-quinone oxidoreductase subunit B